MMGITSVKQYLPVLAGVGFYQVYSKKAPADPFGQMKTDAENYTFEKLKTKWKELATAAAVIILLPMVNKTLSGKVPPAVKLIVTAAAWYIVGDQLGKVLDDDVYPTRPSINGMYNGRVVDCRNGTWDRTGSSAKNQGHVGVCSGTIRNIYGA